MKNWWKNIWLSDDIKQNSANNRCVENDNKEDANFHSQHLQKIEKGAKDFAVRFEDVMKELSNG